MRNMTRFCENCECNDHESCMMLHKGLLICTRCQISGEDYCATFSCDCSKWSKEDLIIKLHAYEGQPNCLTCDSPIINDKARIQMKSKPSNEDDSKDCDCTSWDAEAMIYHMDHLGQKCIECKGWITQSCIDFCEDYKKWADRFCRCKNVDLKQMESRISIGVEVCADCNKIFTRLMLEHNKRSANAVDHPYHYQSPSGMEAIDVIEAFQLNFNKGNAVKYILRSGKKVDEDQDIDKAIWYLKRQKEKKHEIRK